MILNHESWESHITKDITCLHNFSNHSSLYKSGKPTWSWRWDMMIKTLFETLCFAAKMTDLRKYLHQSRFAAIRAMLWSKAWNLWGRTWIQTGGKYVVITIAKYHKVKIIITNRKYSWNHQFVHCQNQPCYHCYLSWLKAFYLIFEHLNIYEVAIC